MNINTAIADYNIRELQGYLLALSHTDPRIPRVAVTGVYNADTEAALRAFQRTADLPETGTVDHATWDALIVSYEDAARPFTRGAALVPLYNAALSESPDALASLPQFYALLQVVLRVLSDIPGFAPPPEITGANNDATRTGIAAAQRIAGLPETGELDIPTWNAIAGIYNHEMTKAQLSPPIKKPDEILAFSEDL